MQPFEQPEMIPKSPRECAIALRNWVIVEQDSELESFAKKTQTHKQKMDFLEQQLRNTETVLDATPDEDGVIANIK